MVSIGRTVPDGDPVSQNSPPSPDHAPHPVTPLSPSRVSPVRGPPQAELHLDQSPAFDLAARDAIPEFEFDQSSPQDWDA